MPITPKAVCGHRAKPVYCADCVERLVLAHEAANKKIAKLENDMSFLADDYKTLLRRLERLQESA